jgi:hypothetical protein
MSTCAGPLLKKGRIIRSNLKKRYFELVGTHLFYYASHAAAARGVGVAKGSDNLAGLQAAMVGGADATSGCVPIVLVLRDGQQVEYLCKGDTLEDSVVDARRWVAALVQLIPKQVKSVIQGQLSHSTDKGLTWSSRFVMLLPDEMLVFARETDSTSPDPFAVAMLRLRLTSDFFTADAAGGATREFAFQVCDLEGSASYYLAAPDAQLKMFWMLAISRIIEKMMQETVQISSMNFNGASVVGSNPLVDAQQHDQADAKRAAAEQRVSELAGKPRGRLLYDFEAENDGEISVAAGEIVILLELVDDDFWIAQHGSVRGFVQSDYIEVLQAKKVAPAPPRRKKMGSVETKTASAAASGSPSAAAAAPVVPNRANKPASTGRADSIPGAPPAAMAPTTKAAPPVPSRANKPVKNVALKQERLSARMTRIQELSFKRKRLAEKKKQDDKKREQEAEETKRAEAQKKKEEEENIRREQEALEQRRQDEEARRERERKELERAKSEAEATERKKRIAREKAEFERKQRAEQEKIRKEKERMEKKRREAQHAKEKKEKAEKLAREKREKEEREEAARLKAEEDKLREEEAKDVKRSSGLISRKGLGAPPAVPQKSAPSSMANPRRTSVTTLGKNSRVKPAMAKKSEATAAASMKAPAATKPSRKSVIRPSRKSVGKGGGRSKGGGGIKARLAMWQKKTDDYAEGQKGNVFSKSYEGGGKKLKAGDPGYGVAKVGSKTEERAKAAKAWCVYMVSLLLVYFFVHFDKLLTVC